MSYHKDVRSLVYGAPDMMQALIMKHRLNGVEIVQRFAEYGISVYDIEVQIFDGKNRKSVRWTVIDLDYGGNWYGGEPDTMAWIDILRDADEFECHYEHVVIGEEREDMLVDYSENSNGFLGINRTISVDMPKKLTDEKVSP